MSAFEAAFSLDGDLHYYPLVSQREKAVWSQYQPLYREYGIDDVLILGRFPPTVESTREAIAAQETIESVHSVTAKSLLGHAREVHGRIDAAPEILRDPERSAFIRQFIRDVDWQEAPPFLAQASTKEEGFVDDVGRFVTELNWQGGTVSAEDPIVSYLVNIVEELQERFAAEGYVTRPLLVSYVLGQLSDELTAAPYDKLEQSDEDPLAEYEAVLIPDFEEFAPRDRAYLSVLTHDTELVALATADSAIQRVWNETLPITERTDLALHDHTDETSPETLTESVATFLGTGESPHIDEFSTVKRIAASTFREQVEAVGAEIERLASRGRQYDEIAVVLRDSAAPIADVVNRFQQMGIPVASETTTSMEHDPAARELYNVVAVLQSDADIAATIPSLSAVEARHSDLTQRQLPELDSQQTVPRECLFRLLGRIDTPPAESAETTDQSRTVAESGARERVECSPEMVTDLLETARDQSLSDGLTTWIRGTQLIHRIARDADKRVADIRFDHIERILSLAEFLEEETSFAGDWDEFLFYLDEDVSNSSTDRVPAESTLKDGAVAVDATRVFKNDRREVVFVLNLVEGGFPKRPTFNRLFPPSRTQSLANHPVVSDPTHDEVDRTFSTVTDDDLQQAPKRAYYYALHRRFLAVAAKVADKRLYLCSYEEDEGLLGGQRQESRFLRMLEQEFGAFPEVAAKRLQTRGDALTYTQTRLDRALQVAQRRVATNQDIDMDAIQTEFQIAQHLLDDLDEQVLERGIQTTLDLAKGEVTRDE